MSSFLIYVCMLKGIPCHNNHSRQLFELKNNNKKQQKNKTKTKQGTLFKCFRCDIY